MIVRHPRFYLALLSAVLLAAPAGCGSDKGTNPIQSHGPRYPILSSPQNVLVSMELAYSARDSSAYDSLFDSTYVGTSFDPNNLNQLNFTKADERRHVSALARTPSIVNVSVQFPHPLIRETDGADPPGWATIHIQNALIEISDSPSSVFITPNVTQEFKFEPTTPSAGSPTDTTWHIVRWTELP